MRKKFIKKKFQDKTLAVISEASKIVKEYYEYGYRITFKQLYYRLTTREIIPNTASSLLQFTRLMVNARLAGKFDWLSLENTSSKIYSLPFWPEIKSYKTDVVTSFRVDKWKNQTYRVELWLESGTLLPMLRDYYQELNIPIVCSYGQMSLDQLYSASERFHNYREEYKQIPVIFYIGDLNPFSFLAMRNIDERLQLFDEKVRIERLALLYAQVEEYHILPQPKKFPTDSQWIAQYGKCLWEVAAIDPSLVLNIMNDKLKEYFNYKLYNLLKEEENKLRNILR